MTQAQRAEIANEILQPGTPQRKCIPRSTPENAVICRKPGGVCSLRQYVEDAAGVLVAEGRAGSLRTVCPNRFEEGGSVFSWIGERLLDHPTPTIAAEIGFLEREPRDLDDPVNIASTDDVGRIDHVLIDPRSSPLRWCALEVQAVYFSGPSMTPEFKAIALHDEDSIPFPAKIRRPDYRSSGPKRLMPQLQIKVPSLRRWGKKMVVLVDVDFFDALGKMDNVPHLSNCDIIWFIVRYVKEDDGQYHIALDRVQYTTLEHAVEGLTAGRPVSLELFEQRLRAKIGTRTTPSPSSSTNSVDGD